MSRILAWRRLGGGAAGHVFVWPTNGAAAAALTTLYRPWLLYGRLGGAHGQLFAWHSEGASGAPVGVTTRPGGRKSPRRGAHTVST